MTTFLTAFAATLLAEMGDKTQLVTLTLSTRHPPLQVLAGALGALAAITGLAVVLGDYLAVLLPAQLALLAGGIFFLVIGIFMLLKKEEKEDSKPADSNSAIALQTFIMVFLAELGDKTQLTAIAPTAATGKPAAVFLSYGRAACQLQPGCLSWFAFRHACRRNSSAAGACCFCFSVFSSS